MSETTIENGWPPEGLLDPVEEARLAKYEEEENARIAAEEEARLAKLEAKRKEAAAIIMAGLSNPDTDEESSGESKSQPHTQGKDVDDQVLDGEELFQE